MRTIGMHGALPCSGWWTSRELTGLEGKPMQAMLCSVSACRPTHQEEIGDCWLGSWWATNEQESAMNPWSKKEPAAPN